MADNTPNPYLSNPDNITPDPRRSPWPYLALIGGLALLIVSSLFLYLTTHQLIPPKVGISPPATRPQPAVSSSEEMKLFGQETPHAVSVIDPHLAELGINIKTPPQWEALWLDDLEYLYGLLILAPSDAVLPAINDYSGALNQARMLNQSIIVQIGHTRKMMREIPLVYNLEELATIPEEEPNLVLLSSRTFNLAGKEAFQLVFRDPSQNRLSNRVFYVAEDAYGMGVGVHLEYSAQEGQYQPDFFLSMAMSLTDQFAEQQRNSADYQTHQVEQAEKLRQNDQFLEAFAQKYGFDPRPKYIPIGLEPAEININHDREKITASYWCPLLPKKEYEYPQELLRITTRPLQLNESLASFRDNLLHENRSRNTTYDFTETSVNGLPAYFQTSTSTGVHIDETGSRTTSYTSHSLVWTNNRLFLTIDIPANCRPVVDDATLLKIAESLN